MVATVRVVEKNGSSASPTLTQKDGGTVRFKNADDANVDLNNPMVIPSSGSDWSFEKWLRLEITGGTFTEITNLKFYTDGANNFGTGVNLWAKNVATYATPAEGTGSTGYSDAFGYTSAAPLNLGAGPYTAVGEIGDHVVMLLEVQSTAASGVLPGETVTFAYDEI